jgi:uncharacterized protein YegL
MTQTALPARRPGGALATRPLRFFWLIDGSGSMRIDARATALQHALREAQPLLAAAARAYPQAQVTFRTLRFARRAEWLDGAPVAIDGYAWADVQGDGLTALGAAIDLLREDLPQPEAGRPSLPSVVVLITDGLPTDEVTEPLRRFAEHPWAARSLRVVIGLGDDFSAEEMPEIFQLFIGRDWLRPILVPQLEELAAVILRVGTQAIRAVCDPSGPDFADFREGSEDAA